MFQRSEYLKERTDGVTAMPSCAGTTKTAVEQKAAYITMSRKLLKHGTGAHPKNETLYIEDSPHASACLIVHKQIKITTQFSEGGEDAHSKKVQNAQQYRGARVQFFEMPWTIETTPPEAREDARTDRQSEPAPETERMQPDGRNLFQRRRWSHNFDFPERNAPEEHEGSLKDLPGVCQIHEARI